MQQITIGPNQAGQRLDKFLHKYLPEAPNSFLYKMLRKKNITLNGKKAEGKEMLRLGDEVKMFFAEETLAKFSGQCNSPHPGDKGRISSPEPAVQDNEGSGQSAVGKLAETCRRAFLTLHGIDVLYEDEHVLILNKPAGILTQKAEVKDLSLNEWMIGYLLEKGCVTEDELHTFRPSVCNRLDRNTSGLVLCGKSLAGSQALSQAVRERTVRKFYRTIASGRITRPSRIEGYLVKDGASNKVTVTSVENGTDASYIQTAYTPLKVLCLSDPKRRNHPAEMPGYQKGNVKPGELTYLEVELITGKPHQIRAHLAGTGHPLLGDYKYGSKNINDPFKSRYRLEGQLLHAYRLEFPELGGALTGVSGKQITAPLPDLFQRILADYGEQSIS